MKAIERPQTLQQVAEQSEKLEDFGLLLRDWIHVILREDVSNRRALRDAVNDPPAKRGGLFDQGEVCDAYLGAYAEWICDKAGVKSPEWTSESFRFLENPWFADHARASLLALTPSAFRNHGVYTIPEDVVKLRRGRPKVDTEQKRLKARERDRRYRKRIKNLIAKARQAGVRLET